MFDIYAEIVKALEKRQKVALATLIRRVGSAPRAEGAKYLVREDGYSFGTIGGGCVEAEVWQEAKEVIRSNRSKVLHFSLKADQVADIGLICGGDIDILVEPLLENELEIYRQVIRTRQRGGAAILATIVSIDGSEPTDGKKAYFRSSGERVGHLPDGRELEKKIVEEGKIVLADKKPRLTEVSLNDRKIAVLLEPVVSEPTVYIFGAGHVSEQIAPIAKKVHFKVVVIDDRETFANRTRFPEADEVIVTEFENCFERLSIDESSYIVIVTRGHLYDSVVLEQALNTDARYIGMIGSRRKIVAIFENLRKKGIPEEKLERVYAPIGIDINSETPEEIAVSIVAQLIKVRGEPLDLARLDKAT